MDYQMLTGKNNNLSKQPWVYTQPEVWEKKHNIVER
jgi:hypothetical protein